MSTGVRLFHPIQSEVSYVLVKPTENKVYLYQLDRDGSIAPNAKPLMRKTYKKHYIHRWASFPYSMSFDDYSRYNIWRSRVPRLNSSPKKYEHALRTFSIRNREGDFGNILRLKGYVNNNGDIEEVRKLKFPPSEYNILQYNIPNLTKIYLTKIFKFFIEKTPIKDKFYISPEEMKSIKESHAARGIPPFEVTDTIRASIKTLAEKHKIL